MVLEKLKSLFSHVLWFLGQETCCENCTHYVKHKVRRQIRDKKGQFTRYQKDVREEYCSSGYHLIGKIDYCPGYKEKED